MKMVFLKEFPEITGGYEACYQAVTSGAIRLNHVMAGGVFGWKTHELRILECFSHRIVQELGLWTRTRETGEDKLVRDVIDPLLGWHMRWRGVVDPGVVIWPEPQED